MENDPREIELLKPLLNGVSRKKDTASVMLRAIVTKAIQHFYNLSAQQSGWGFKQIVFLHSGYGIIESYFLLLLHYTFTKKVDIVSFVQFESPNGSSKYAQLVSNMIKKLFPDITIRFSPTMARQLKHDIKENLMNKMEEMKKKMEQMWNHIKTTL